MPSEPEEGGELYLLLFEKTPFLPFGRLGPFFVIAPLIVVSFNVELVIWRADTHLYGIAHRRHCC